MYVAQKLGRTLAELRATVGNDEFVLWTRYYARQAQREELEAKKAGG